MDPLFSTLLSIAGQNRPIGTGDVVPFQRTTTDSPDAREAQAARPGAAQPGAFFDPHSSLSNLSALLPAYNAALQAQIAGAIPSGTASAVAQPLPVAAPGPSSNDVTAAQAQVGSVPIAGAPGIGLAAPAPAPAPSVPDSTPSGAGDAGAASGGAGVGTGDAGSGTGDSGGAAAGVGDGTAGGIGGDAAGGEGGPGAGSAGDSGGVGDGGAAGDGGGGGAGDGGGPAGDYAKGGFVTKGKPNSKTDDVSAKLQHGEFVIPRAAVIHLAAHAPEVLSHVMHVSAMHHLANQAKDRPSPGAMLTGQNGGLPPQGQPVQHYRNGGLVMPAGAMPQVHPAALDLIRRAIAAHSQPQAPMMGPARGVAGAVSPAAASVGRPAPVPPMARLDATKNATGGSRGGVMGRRPTQV